VPFFDFITLPRTKSRWAAQGTYRAMKANTHYPSFLVFGWRGWGKKLNISEHKGCFLEVRFDDFTPK